VKTLALDDGGKIEQLISSELNAEPRLDGSQTGIEIQRVEDIDLELAEHGADDLVGGRRAEPASPFGGVYTGVDRTRKRAIDERLIARLKSLDLPVSGALPLARDLFVFSYCMRGMAFVDMAFLRKKDMRDGAIHYVRRKTGQRMTVHLEPCMREIIGRYAPRTRDTPYLFPVLTAEDPARAYAQYQVALNYYNRLLKKLASLLGLDSGLSSYTSRHSWATAARNHNVPLPVISAGMGHTSERTTQIYLSALETSVIDSANRKILASLNRCVSC